MQRIVTKNKKGFTLVELLVSMLVLSIGMMAMLDGIGHYVRINIDNSVRSEALRIAEASLETLRNSSFDYVKTNNNTIINIPTTQQKKFRNIDINYGVVWQSYRVTDNSYAIQVIVTWTHRNVNHRHDAASIISTDV